MGPSTGTVPSSVVSNLANLLPTGTYLAFQTMAPLFTNNGDCGATEKIMTGLLLLLFTFICFILNFTDSITTESGRVYYGLVTCRGLFNPHFASIHPSTLPGLRGYFYTSESDPTKFQLNLFDVINGLLVVVTFASLTMLTSPITDCFYPSIPVTVVKCVPILVSLLVGMYFGFAPPARRGYGFAIVVGKDDVVKESKDSSVALGKISKDRTIKSILEKKDSKHSNDTSSNPDYSPSPGGDSPISARLTRINMSPPV